MSAALTERHENGCPPEDEAGAASPAGFRDGTAVVNSYRPQRNWGARVLEYRYRVGLEPFSSFPTNGLKEAVDNGTALSLGAREKRSFSLRAEVFEGGPS